MFSLYHSFRQCGFLFTIENTQEWFLFQMGNGKKHTNGTCSTFRSHAKKCCADYCKCVTNAVCLLGKDFASRIVKENGPSHKMRNRPRKLRMKNF